MLFLGLVAQVGWNGGLGDGLIYGNADQFLWQVIAVVAAPVYAFGMTYALLKLIGAFATLRVSERDEALGLDVVSHGEEAYVTGEGALLLEPDEIWAERRAEAEPVTAG